MPIRPGLFSSRKFQIIGFDESETESLENLVREKGGSVLPFDANVSEYMSRSRDVDYTIMPTTIPSCISNAGPATVFWLRKCIEQNKLLPLDQDVFYQPIPR
jgi:hypothetical protein